jgi:hypothetical protein
MRLENITAVPRVPAEISVLVIFSAMPLAEISGGSRGNLAAPALCHNLGYDGATPVDGAALIYGEHTMRVLLLASAALALAGMAIAAPAATKLAPQEIQATFFTGTPFTASRGATKYKMTYNPDGKMTREPIGTAGPKSEGTWKLSKDGFCSTWKGSKASCYTVQASGDNKWSVMKGTTVAATWSK